MNAKELMLDLDTIAEKFVMLTQDEWFAHIRAALLRLESAEKELAEIKERAKMITERCYNNPNVAEQTVAKGRIDFIIKGEGK